ncbi:hypothetical protein GGX14DRAFT_631780 [Mycena pura]|uniref:Uncharacterized protein n=1 Tax=Mycena pura TaxID=153505 RepID=A0AAD6YF08_9AGAR|nr:hypothetical protein GGX14DRAFT_631780 [Mycena pura]
MSLPTTTGFLPPSQTARIVLAEGKKYSILHSRIPVVVYFAWRALLSDSPLGRQLRRPYWLPYKDYDEVSFESQSGDDVLLSFLSQLRGNQIPEDFTQFLNTEAQTDECTWTRFKVYIALPSSSESDSESLAEHQAFMPKRTDSAYSTLPAICFTPGFHHRIEAVRQRIILSPSPSPDDITELQQLDVMTLACFFHELGHLVWRAQNPHSTIKCTPEKYKAQHRSRAQEGGEWVECELFGGVLDVEMADWETYLAAAGLFYMSWAGGPLGRNVCLIHGNDESRCLTRTGAAKINNLFFGASESPEEICPGPEMFISLSIPSPSPTPSPTARAKLGSPQPTSSHPVGTQFLTPRKDELPRRILNLIPRRRPRARLCVLSTPPIDNARADAILAADIKASGSAHS